MKIINMLFCLLFILLNSCNSDNNDAFNKKNTQEVKNIKKRDLSETEKPKSPEELLKKKLNDDQKKQLDWLKTALTDDGKFDKFLENDESKIKSALDHIKSELDKCTGEHADQQKTTFKEVVKAALEGNNIDNVNQATCNNFK
ncbi:Mlp family lipoprotein [Borreliella garinii]|uniref:Mlp family lipoprotein n=1 Tax=Borreliella garinii TaxID=29519 RepID=UPI00018ACF74|nr:Mlp family lipoprotein [Borreliella garinii]ACL35295.1 lipoprotein [Borreliella garinii Far04]WNZ67148.1 Mlp family lipoprotein [Borreliella garinii]WNZ68147.1 Mlp family lipoprotein [Borreliella garinii]WNZ69145.1 Mlp family lipoprotein [Borreliella garinii]WNZ70145.1 Mlp family lipoprotein [Borreliella garinii]